ncbi:MAG: RidA family protein [Saprospiraceae bacterium]|nr:RidA family protein [Saprospiraceae bacterium]
MENECINPDSLFNSTQYGFSQIVVSNPGKIVHISGQVAWNEKMKIFGKNNLAKQTQKSIDNLKIAIESANGCLNDIVMLRIYIVNYKKEDGPVINKILKNNFGVETPPASTWISVAGLSNEDFLIEIEAQAII